MQQMELASRKRSRRGQLESVILTSLAGAGVALVAMAAPNTLQLLKHVDPNWIRKRDPKRRIREACSRLKKKGLVAFVTQNGQRRVRITAAGKQKLNSMMLHGPLPKPKRWDGKWRLVIFDIPEKRRPTRARARSIVAGFGFARLQDSVWAYPYDCEETIALLKTELKIGKDLLYIIADAIEFDVSLRATFNLPRD